MLRSFEHHQAKFRRHGYPDPLVAFQIIVIFNFLSWCSELILLLNYDFYVL
jgi:hypothetical protein